MAKVGLLGKGAATKTSEATLYVVPDSVKIATVDVHVKTEDETRATWLYIYDPSSLGNSQWLVPVIAERTGCLYKGIVLGPGQRVVLGQHPNGANASVIGVEEDA